MYYEIIKQDIIERNGKSYELSTCVIPITGPETMIFAIIDDDGLIDCTGLYIKRYDSVYSAIEGHKKIKANMLEGTMDQILGCNKE